MRGTISDQDLTDYALNELAGHERRYVEGMLAVSEPCRADVYHLLEVARMLEDGFGRQSDATEVALLPSQRLGVLQPRRGAGAAAWVRRGVVGLGLAACAVWSLSHGGLWPRPEPAVVVAQVPHDLAPAIVPQVATPSLPMLDAFADDTSAWLQTAMEALPEPTVVCTPPSWVERAEYH